MVLKQKKKRKEKSQHYTGLNGVPPKSMFFQEPQDVTLFGSRISADIIKMRSSWSTVDPKFKFTGIPISEEKREKDRHTGQTTL